MMKIKIITMMMNSLKLPRHTVDFLFSPLQIMIPLKITSMQRKMYMNTKIRE